MKRWNIFARLVKLEEQAEQKATILSELTNRVLKAEQDNEALRLRLSGPKEEEKAIPESFDWRHKRAALEAKFAVKPNDGGNHAG